MPLANEAGLGDNFALAFLIGAILILGIFIWKFRT